MRLIYIPLNQAPNMKQYVNQNFQNFVKIDGRFVFFSSFCGFVDLTLHHFVRSDIAVLCIAVYAANGSTNVRAVADKLRAIQGPEDCQLAVKTDPNSIRAIYGDRER